MSQEKNAILGISAFYHDSAAAVVADGRIIAAAQEERFSRRKHDPGFPAKAVSYVLSEAGLAPKDLAAIAFYDKPLLKFERLLETAHAFAPSGLGFFSSAMPAWIKEKLFLRRMIKREIKELGLDPGRVPMLFPEHHLSHGASAFFPSPFEKAAILTIDGVGEWATTTIAKGSGNGIELLLEMPFPHSIGLLYSAFTYFCGFRVNSGEYKLMGLAPFGDPDSSRTKKFREKITSELVRIHEDGSILLNLDYFAFTTGMKMCHDRRWEHPFGMSKREAESEIGQEHADLALAIQQVTEDIVLRLVRKAREETGCSDLVMAGGVALNCVANGRLLAAGIFDRIWIQPAAGDAGGALGAALAAHHIWLGAERQATPPDSMQGALLGPEFSDLEVKRMCRRFRAVCEKVPDNAELDRRVAKIVADGGVVGWFQGRMEFGPRALGNRSIIADPRNPEMQKTLNLKIKYREGFRPFAPAVLADRAAEWFDLDTDSPYMLLVRPVKKEHLTETGENENEGENDIYGKVARPRSTVPAVTHVDCSARIQTVSEESNPRFGKLLEAFNELTGCPILINTSFNVRGEPVVCTPEDAYRCFMRTGMDWLAINNFLFEKKKQPQWRDDRDWREEYQLD